MIITISGKPGVGKTTLANLIKENFKNVIHFDFDKINSDFLNQIEVKNFAVSIFGKSVLNNKMLDKKVIFNNIFYDKLKYKKWCNFMQKKCENYALKQINSNDFIYLLEHVNIEHSKLFNLSDLKILVILDDVERITRIKARDNLTDDEIKLRENYIPNFDMENYDFIYTESNSEDLLEKLKNYENKN